MKQANVARVCAQCVHCRRRFCRERMVAFESHGAMLLAVLTDLWVHERDEHQPAERMADA